MAETSPERTNSAPASSATVLGSAEAAGHDKPRPFDDHGDRPAVMSTKARIYLDFNATAPLGDHVRAAMTRALEVSGNPSSIHAEGRRARDAIEQARDRVARLVGRSREQIVFSSGGTEGNALGVLALAAVAERRGLPRVVAAAAIDHPSLRGAVAALAARGWRVQPIAVDPEGALEVAALDGVGLVALAAVNHELGTVAD
ncbi:MAG TPA: aminotransferase class V-fold PLP-dependent enzyme, partial [Kofleriaceae bacterium]